ncbi:MAG: DNA internalization-related competence protein ComEC/Rec2 [Calditrichaeota bacterium]|nr:DNA internalization-related competence protein ComEC/Rec2 [Calditrichota bacterium]
MQNLTSTSDFGASARRPFVWITLSFAAGNGLAYYLPVTSFLLGALVWGGLLVVILSVFWFPRWVVHGLIMVLFLTGMLRFALWRDAHLLQPFPGPLPSPPLTLLGVVKDVYRPGNNRLSRWVVETHHLTLDTLQLPIRFRVLVYGPDSLARRLYAGSQIRMERVQLDSIPSPRNPGQFHYRRYLYLKGIVCQTRLQMPASVAIDPPGSLRDQLQASFSLLRARLVRQFETYFPRSRAEFMKALILGKREGLDPEIRRNFQLAGLMHVLAISGLHVGFVVVIFHTLLSFLPMYFKHRNILLMGLLFGYMILTGGLPPVVRATLMAGLYLLAINLERNRDPMNILFATGFIILFIAPNQLFWMGFQFSFLAVWSILWVWERFQPLYQQFRRKWGNSRWKRVVLEGIGVPFIITVAAQLGTLPLTILYFHHVSWISLILNLVVLPWIGLLVGLGFLFLATSFLVPAFGEWVAGFTDRMVEWLFRVVQQAVQIPGVAVMFPDLTLSHLFILAIGLALAYWMLRSRRIHLALGIIALTLVMIRLPSGTNSHFLELVAVDVGQGDALVMRTPGGRVAVIDVGPSGRGSNLEFTLQPVFHTLNIRRIHHLFISHPHWDHMGNMFQLVERIPVDSVYLAALPFAYRWQDSLVRFLEKRQVPVRWIHAGDRVWIDDQTRFYVLWPLPPEQREILGAGRNLNNHSLVLLLNFRGQRILFPGDAEEEAERFLLLWRQLLRAEIFKVPHHGSNTSSLPELLDFVNPQLAIVSVGKRNRFGHPSPEVLSRFHRRDIPVKRTDRDGAIWLRFSGKEWKPVFWKKSLRFLKVWPAWKPAAGEMARLE